MILEAVAAGSDDGSVGLSGQGICDWVTCLGLLSGQVIVCVSPSDGQNWGLSGPCMLSLGDTPSSGRDVSLPLHCSLILLVAELEARSGLWREMGLQRGC